MDFKSIAKQVAELGLPLLGTALGGPGGALVGKALASAIGSPSEAPADILKVLTEDSKAKQAAIEFQANHELELKKLSLQEKQMDNDDRKSARDREVGVKDNTTKVLAYTVVGSFVLMVAGALVGYAKVDSALAGTLVGYLSAKAEQVIAYYFGSSSGSAAKTQLLAQAQPITASTLR